MNFTNSEIVNATSLDNDYLHEEVLGVPVYNETSLRDYISRYDNRNAIGNNIAPMDNDYDSSCDLSESIYFPPIGSQLGGSCTSWATTYYQFT